MYFRRAALAALLASFAGCRTKTADSHRYAVLRFENLTGDTALEWTGRAASEVLSRSLMRALDGPVLTGGALARASAGMGGRPGRAPGISTELETAIDAGADTTITGYVARTAGGFRISAQDRRHILSASGHTLPEALGALAKAFSPTAAAPVTASEPALMLFIEGVEGPRESALTSLRAAITADPQFGAAWTALARAELAAGDRAGALATVKKALDRQMEPLEKANLRLEAASAADNAGAKIAALRELAAAAPGDIDLPRVLAEAATAASQFGEAARQWEKLTTEVPKNPDVWNQLGYARAWSGDYNGALAALQEYSALRPGDPNPLDSLGDVQYMHRKFAAAADSYLKANSIDPDFQDGGDLYKAAWARFRTGNRPEADNLFSRFRAIRAKTNKNTVLFAADWLYRTGRGSEAVAALRNENLTTPPQSFGELAFAQLTIWELLAGDRTAANKDAQSIGAPTTFATLLARFAALPSASAIEWENRAQRTLAGDNAAKLRPVALSYALLLDGKRDASLPFWEQATAQVPGTDFFLRAINSKLKGVTPLLEVAPDPSSVNPFAAVLDKL